MDGKRIRSPNYPALSLPDAIDKVTSLYKAQHTHSAPREVAVKGMGYNTLNGASATAISALHKYGLLERVGDEVKVSDRALRILHPESPAERSGAILEAAHEPPLFGELAERFPGRLPSDDLLRNFLIRRGFAPGAVTAVMLAYRETSEMAEREGAAHDSAREQPPEQAAMPQPPESASHFTTTHQTTPVPRSVAAKPNVERAEFPLQEGLATVELPRALSEESYEDLVDWLRLVLRKTRRVAMAGRIPESTLVIPALECIYDAGGQITTTDLIRRLEDWFQPEGEDDEILDGRADTKFSQKVRNLKSHKTLEKAGYAIEIDDGFELTEAGKKLVEATRL
jgi:hypothetical protein